MKFILVIFILVFSVFADSRKDCFDQYNLGKITKKELMKCSNIKDRGYLKVPKIDIPTSKVLAKKKSVVHGVDFSKKFDIVRVGARDIGELKKVRIGFTYEHSEANYQSLGVRWKNDKVLVDCELYESNWRATSKGWRIGSVYGKKLFSSSDKIFVKRKSTKSKYGLIECVLSYQGLKYNIKDVFSIH